MKPTLYNKSSFMLYNLNCSEHLLRYFADLGKDRVDTILMVVGNHNCPIDLLEKFSSGVSYEGYSDINPEEIKKRIATNPSCPEKILIKLSEDESTKVRGSLARNSNISDELVLKLSNDDNWVVRSNIAIHNKIPIEVLKKLSNDSSSNVRINVALNPKTPKEILEQLFTDKNEDVKNAVLINPNTPDYLRVVEGL